MEMTTHAVSWVEIPVTDFERAKKFYSAIFDYDMPEMMLGPVRLGILLYDQAKGGIGGAILHGEGEPSSKGTRLYLNGGSDLNHVLSRVTPAGGRVIEPKTEITPEFGYFATFEDPEGNYVSLHSMG